MLDELLNILNTVGQVVDTPWAAVRTGIRDRSIGSGLESILDVDQRATGREMLESLGMSENQPGLDWGDVAGFAVEVVPDMLLPGAGAYKLLKYLRGADEATDIGALMRAIDKRVPDPIRETVYHASPRSFDTAQLSPGRMLREPTGFYTATTADEALRSTPWKGEVTPWEFAPRQPFDLGTPGQQSLYDSLYTSAVNAARKAASSRYANDPIIEIPEGLDDFVEFYSYARQDDMPRIPDIFRQLLMDRGYDAVMTPQQLSNWRIALDPAIVSKQPQAIGENALLALLSGES